VIISYPGEWVSIKLKESTIFVDDYERKTQPVLGIHLKTQEIEGKCQDYERSYLKFLYLE